MKKALIGLVLCFVIGCACRLAAIPLPSPPVLVGALLVVAMTLGYEITDRYLAKHPATTKHLCAGPSGETRIQTIPGKNHESFALRKTGSLDDLRVVEIDQPKPAADEALVQIKAAAINPSDVKNVLGKMHDTSVPRVPGRDFAGLILEGPACRMDR